MSFLWTTEKIQTAVELWNAGKTGSEIAQAINAPSRGSVTRKIARLRACGMPVAERSSPIRPKPVNIEAVFPVVPVGPARSHASVTLVEAGFRQCRYPLWNAPADPRLVCGRTTVDPLSSWCAEHGRLVWKAR